MESKAEQYYPTYTFKSESRDVLLLEFEEAQKIANGQTKVYGQVTNILLAFITILIPLFFNQDKDYSFDYIKENALFFSIVIFLFGALLLRYFVDLQKQITINARKVVTLRKMLGLDYGHIHLTLPNWRVEGATNPFAIKYFNGWMMFQSMPFWVLTIGVNAIWWLTTKNRADFILFSYTDLQFKIPWLLGNCFISIVYLFIFRRNLNDSHETVYLSIVKWFSRIIGFKLVDNFEYTIYRTKLAVVEIDRLKIDYRNMKMILIQIEDKDFYNNKGISWLSIGRAFLSQFKFIRNRKGWLESGGSTITMQLARTLFIETRQNKYFRKLFEILLSFWLRSKFSKKEILDMYISSVRYDYGIMGLPKAIKHFFGELKRRTITPEESFILVERLSNVTGTYRQQRVDYLLSKLKGTLDQSHVNLIYQQLITDNKIKIQ